MKYSTNDKISYENSPRNLQGYFQAFILSGISVKRSKDYDSDGVLSKANWY